MSARPLAPARRPTLKVLAWLLLFALALQGCAGALVQVLGPTHTHRAAADAQRAVEHQPATAAWLDSLLAWRASQLQHLQATSVFKHAAAQPAAHQHGDLERHHHGVGDTTVVALDGAASDAASDAGHGPAGGSAPPWGPMAAHSLVPALLPGGSWPGTPAWAWSSAARKLPERPPKA